MRVITLVVAGGVVASIIVLSDLAEINLQENGDVDIIFNGTHLIGKRQPEDLNPSLGLPTFDLAADVMRHDPLWDNAIFFTTGTLVPTITKARIPRFERGGALEVAGYQIQARILALAACALLESPLPSSPFLSYSEPETAMLGIHWVLFDPDARPTGRFWSPDLPLSASNLLHKFISRTGRLDGSQILLRA